MSFNMPAGASYAYDAIYDEQHRIEIEMKLQENALHEAYHEAICAFYQNGLSWSAAESMAKLWARNFSFYGWDDAEVVNIANKLKLEEYDAYAILGDQARFNKERGIE